jgi:PilZ domain
VSEVDRPENSSSGTTTASSPTSKPARRRGARIPLEFPVLISYQTESGETSRTNARTSSVSVNGAPLILEQPLVLGQNFVLTNANTDKKVDCTVRSVNQKSEKTFHAGVEFATWCPDFWQVVFPREEDDPPGERHTEEELSPAPRGAARARQSARPATPRATSQKVSDKVSETQAPAGPQKRAHGKLLAASVVMIGIVVVWLAMGRGPAQTGSNGPPEAAPELPSGIPASDGFRLATPHDFAPNASLFLKRMSQEVGGSIAGNFASTGQSEAYVLLKNSTSWRVVILANGQPRCDIRYGRIAFAARVPQALAQTIRWKTPPSFEPDGDGLLVVASATDPGSGVVLFLHGAEAIAGTPVDYTQIPLARGF